MKRLAWFGLAMVAACFSATILSAQSTAKKEKSPMEVAHDAYRAVRDEKTEFSTQRVQAIIDAGLGFLVKYPAAGRTESAISSLVSTGASIRDPKQAAIRDFFFSRLNYEIVTKRSQFSENQEVLAMLAALSTAAAGQEVKLKPSREAATAYQGKLNELIQTPGAVRFLPAQERDYIQFLYRNNPAAAETRATKMMQFPDKRVAEMARIELAYINLKKEPLVLKGTTIDGKAIDTSKLKNKPFYLFFWSLTNPDVSKDIDKLKELARDYKGDVEIITINLDPETDRAKVLAEAKKIKLPVQFEGLGRDTELTKKLLVSAVPSGFWFNDKSLLVTPNLRPANLETEIKKTAKK